MKNSLVQDILRLQEIPLPEGPAPKEEEDELSRIKKKIAEERRAHAECIKKIYREKARGGYFRKIVTIDPSAAVKHRYAVSQQLKTEFAIERAYAEKHRPQTRLECMNGERPCPWVTCRYHLALGVTERGTIQLNFPDPRPGSDFPEINFDDITETCALDAVDRSAPFSITLEEIGLLMNLTRERVRQIEEKGLQNLRNQCALDVGISDTGISLTTLTLSSDSGNGNGNGKDKLATDESSDEETDQFDEKVFADLKL